MAATWALMSMTRTIDSLCIQIDDRNFEFGKVADVYPKQGNRKRKTTVTFIIEL